MASTALATRKRLVTQGLTPEEFFEAYGGKPVPDPITFMISPEWLDRGNLYPRQATLLKLVFLREDLFTEYDRMVLQEWMDSFSQTQNNGIQPDVMTRLAMLRAEGRKWFREILLVMGRRAGKGHISRARRTRPRPTCSPTSTTSWCTRRASPTTSPTPRWRASPSTRRMTT
jgi:hypothetical protein